LKKSGQPQNGKKAPKIPGLVNVSIHRAVLDRTHDFLSALIVELIHYRFIKNDNKPVWLKIDWIHEKLPYISRAGLAKKLDKLVNDGEIIVKKGEGRHYHKCWYSLSPIMLEIFNGEGLVDTSKVYYNLEMAEENLDASVIYATISNLLKLDEGIYESPRSLKNHKFIVGRDYGRVHDKLLLDYKKLADGSGLSLSQVRKAVKWLIKNKKIEAKSVFGNKKNVWLPPDSAKKIADLETYLKGELPTESYSHFDPSEDEPTEKYPHEG
jgi:hypothetical protein